LTFRKPGRLSACTAFQGKKKAPPARFAMWGLVSLRYVGDPAKNLS
jgi:hypothetical protein